VTAYPLPERSAGRVVSPELVLVDPVLAAVERSLLPDISDLGESVRPSSGMSSAEPGWRALAPVEHTRPEPGRRRPANRRSWPRLAGVAAATVLALVLLDVRVNVGRTPAAAEESDPPAHEQSSGPIAPRRATKEAEVDPGVARSRATKGNPPTPATSRRPVRAEARRFAWAPVSGADSYLVELYRRETRVFTATSSRPGITIPASWRYDGSRRSLVAGEYRWYVWAIDSGKRASTAVVQAALTIP